MDRNRHAVPTLATAALAAFVLGLALSVGSAQPYTGGGTPPVPHCREQHAQDFLIRGNWQTKARMSPEERASRRALAERAVRYRTEHYGYFEGFGRPEWNERTPMQNAERTTFFGKPVKLNRRILPALSCVEAAIRAECTATPYQPQRLSGIRDRNTYHNGEVSNHVYGIAIDVDPTRNTCCHCVAPWNEHPLCRAHTETIWERMVMPECWVRVFERYGFYWLGHDQLEDTMHFEFLGEPDRILDTTHPPPSPDAGAALP